MRLPPNKLRLPMIAGATYGTSFAGAIQREYSPRRNAAKLLARMSNSSIYAAKTWVTGKHAPHIDQLVPLLANCDALHAEFMALIEEARRK